MSRKTTRRAFVGGGIVAAAGVGYARLGSLEALTRDSRAFALRVPRLHADGDLPAFGTLRPDASSDPASWGDLHDRTSGARVGSIAITPVTGSAVRAHTLTFGDGTLVAAGTGPNGRYPIVSGTGRYAGARGHVATRGAAHAALDIDIELEL